jgi:hypothetical protein
MKGLEWFKGMTGSNIYAVCADVNGLKKNFDLAFERKPEDIAYFVEQIEYVFRKECYDPANYRSFALDFIVFYEEASRRWRPLESCSQLYDHVQLYVFQSNIAKETITEIPPPVKCIRVPNVPTQSSRSVHNPGFSVVDIEKVEAVFREIDINGNDEISYEELSHAFIVAGVDFTEDAIRKLFDKSDANSDGMISWDEFRIFADLFPNTTETLFWRLCQATTELSPRSLETANELKRLRQREHDLKKQLAEIAAAAKMLEQRLRQERAIAREADPKRRFLEAEEQDLMNKEFALQFHRDMVIQAEAQFSETAVRFDRAALTQGSPRRARQLPS